MHEFTVITVLAAIWGASFIFMKLLSPHLPTLLIANLRILVAGLFLYAVYRPFKQVSIRQWFSQHTFKTLAIIGLFNCVIPFSFYVFAAHHLPIAYSAILNALTPIFTAIVGAIYLNDKISKKAIFGLALGFSGIYVLMLPKLQGVSMIHLSMQQPLFMLSILACMGATMCYAIGASYTKKHALDQFSTPTIACGSQLITGIPMLLFSLPGLHSFSQLQVLLQPKLALSLLALGALSSGVAYVMFFYLVKKGGVMRASLTTFLIPMFGVLWGYLFLAEPVPSTTYLSMLMVFMAVCLVR